MKSGLSWSVSLFTVLALSIACERGAGTAPSSTAPDAAMSATPTDAPESNANTPTPAPTPSPTPVTLENAEGPLFYYVAGAPHEPVLVVIDLATGTHVVEQPLGRFTSVAMRGEQLVARTEGGGQSVLSELGLDGTAVRTIHSATVPLADFEVSPDGTKLVVVEHHTRALVLDWDNLEVVATMSQEQLPVAIGDGVLSWAQWVDDSNQVILDLGVERDGCGPGHVVLQMDGSFRFIEEDDCNHTSPNGRLMADPTGIGCFLIGGETVRILDALSGAEISRYVETMRMLTPWSWSPISSELLVRRMHVREGADPATCTYTSSVDDIIETTDWITIDPATGAATLVEDFDALFDRWLPEYRVTLSCGTPLPQVLWSRFGHYQARCDSDAEMGTVTVDGVPVGEANEIEVLGFVER
jgi:hypothetical protein